MSSTTRAAHSRCLVAAFLALAACGPGRDAVPAAEDADEWGHRPASAATIRLQAAAAAALPLSDPQDFEDTERGLIAREPRVQIEGDDGRVLFDSEAYAFLDGTAASEPPGSVHPALWRQARLNRRHGLYEVTEGVYQVRGYDLANVTFIAGERGWIVVDPLTTPETAAAAFALLTRERGERPVTAVIFTHSHVDHFGGVEAVTSREQVERGEVRVVAPARFVEEATSENVLAGVAMGRRASFMFGTGLARSPRGHVDSGLGVEPVRGRIGLIPPTDIVDRTPQELVLDGVRFVFQHVPESEAPAELTFYVPEKRAFCGAEIVTHTLHNLYTLRGAKVRDALLWSGYIDEAIRLFPDMEVVFATHHWPMWGRERIVDYLKKQRDVYKYIHDQTLRLANAGYTPREISEELELPPSLATSLPNRGYYGTLKHNAKAVYQHYFGWFDGNPAHLDPLPPVEEARRYVEWLGGAAEILRRAEASYAEGDYRWVATVLDHLVFAEPENVAARSLLADTYDQLGYQAESGPWRDFYLTGARELRRGQVRSALDMRAAEGLLRHLPVERFFDSMAARLDGPRAAGRSTVINVVFSDLGESYVLSLENAVLHHRRGEPDPAAAATVRLTREFLVLLATQQAGLRQIVFSDDLEVEGSRLELLQFFSLLSAPDPDFAIVTP